MPNNEAFPWSVRLSMDAVLNYTGSMAVLFPMGIDMVGWEEKDEVQSFKLVKVGKNRIYFEGFTFEKVKDNEINIFALIEDKDGNADEVKFNFTRCRKP